MDRMAKILTLTLPLARVHYSESAPLARDKGSFMIDCLILMGGSCPSSAQMYSKVFIHNRHGYTSFLLMYPQWFPLICFHSIWNRLGGIMVSEIMSLVRIGFLSQPFIHLLHDSVNFYTPL